MGLLSGLPTPNVVIEVFSDSSTNHGPTDANGNLHADAKPKRIIHDAVTVGFSWYSRFPSNAFWTLPQDSIHNVGLVPGLDHIRMWYYNPTTGYGPVLVFNGRLGDPSESGDDVVWTAWSYLAELALSRTGYSVMYKNQNIGYIVEQEWNGDQSPETGTAKYTNYGARKQVSSLLEHIATGTIETPVNAAASHNVKTDAQFGVIDVPRLLLFFDLTEMGRANTTQNVTMEISRTTTPTFNFWKDQGSSVTAQMLTFPGNVLDFRYTPGVMSIRNDLATIGVKDSSATEIIRSRSSGTYGYTAFGRRQDVLTIKTLAGYANIDDDTIGKFTAQGLITDAALNQAVQLTRQIQVDIRPDVFEPFRFYQIEDTIRVQLKRGRTNIDEVYRIVGIRAMLDGQGFRHSLILTLPIS
jgi:hypothetical protein